jgi:hypothetical protein
MSKTCSLRRWTLARSHFVMPREIDDPLARVRAIFDPAKMLRRNANI